MTLASRTTCTGFAKLGAHGLQFGFEICLRDLGRSGFAQALADLDQALGSGLADRITHQPLDRFGGEQACCLGLICELIGKREFQFELGHVRASMSGPLSVTSKVADIFHLFRELFPGIASHGYATPAQLVDHFADRQSRDARGHADAHLLAVEQGHREFQPNARVSRLAPMGTAMNTGSPSCVTTEISPPCASDSSLSGCSRNCSTDIDPMVPPCLALLARS